jgi:squalene-hopene/tetraprenyl-beta-curcumene cyclase
LNEIPFADLRSLIDPSNPDLTGHLLECLGELGLSNRPEAKRGLEYLRNFQRPGGSWYGRWGVNLLYGTCAAVVGMRAAGVPAEDPSLVKALEFILTHQNEDGGWGESCESYLPGNQKAKGPSTPSQTAWALMSLEPLLHLRDPRLQKAIERGVEFLESRKVEDGLRETEFTGTGFPMHFYLRYDGYRTFFPLIALGRLAKKLS